MSGSINIAPADVQPLDFVHWQTAKCPGDNYNQVVAIAPNGDLVIIYRGIRKVIKASTVVAAVRNEPIRDTRGPLLGQSKVWGNSSVQ